MKLLTLTGPSCSGKTTLLNELVANHGFKALVSCTTRPARKGEEYGKDYYFVSDSVFELLKSNNGLMENVEFNGFKYGLSYQELYEASKQGKKPVVIVEPNGLKQITEFCKTHNIEMQRVYVDGNLRDLVKRYLMRSADEDMSNPEIAARHARRIASMSDEVETWRHFDQMDRNPAEMDLYSKTLYDTIIPVYNEDSQAQYIQLIKERYGQG